MTFSRQIAAGDVIPLADFPGYIVGNWYTPPETPQLSAGTAPGANVIKLYPAYIKQLVTLSALGLRIGTLSAGGNVQSAIYAANLATGRPTGNALASTSSISTAATGSVNSAINLQLGPGLYWFGTNCDNGTAVFSSVGQNGLMGQIIGSPTQSNQMQPGVLLNSLSVTQTFGTWPDLTSASFTENVGANNIPLVQFKIGSVP